MAKEATNTKPSMQREWYCLAVHKNTREHTVEYAGAEKQTPPKSRISSSFFLSSFFFSYKTLDLHSLQTKALIELLHAQNDIAFVVVAPFRPFVCKLARWWQFWLAAILQSSNTTPFEQHTKGRGSDVCLLLMHSSHANAFYHSLLMIAVFKELSESLSIRHLVAHDRQEEFLPTCTCPYVP